MDTKHQLIKDKLEKARKARTGNRKPRQSKAVKFATPEYQKSFAVQRANTPASSHRLIDKAEQGSLVAAVKLKCLDCTCEQIDEIRHCPCPDCPLWAFRPYQPKKKSQ